VTLTRKLMLQAIEDVREGRDPKHIIRDPEENDIYYVRGPEPAEHRGRVPDGAIVVPGTRPRSFPAGEYGLPCGLVIGDRSEATDDKIRLNDLLRDAGSSMS